MDAEEMAVWMLARVEGERCLYQVDAVDHLLRVGADELLRINAAGNEVLDSKVLDAFRRLTENTVVWVRRERYWRLRVDEDLPGRDAEL